MITPAFFIALFFTSAEVIFDPCKEYYEYVCRNLHPEKTVELEPYNFLFDFYQGPQLTSKGIEEGPHTNGEMIIYNLIDPAIIFKWIIEIQTRRSSVFWKRLVEVQRTLVELSKIDQINIVEEQLMSIELKRIIMFDMSLTYNIKIMKEKKIPIKKHDRRYHFLFNAVKESMQETIQRNPELFYEEKKHLVTLLHNSSVWFGFVDYTDVLYYELAKSAYDKEFKRLLSLTSRQVCHVDLLNYFGLLTFKRCI